MDLKVPFRDPNQVLTDPDVLRLPEELEDPEERRVADRLLVDAMADPDLATVGDLLDRIEQASPQERRRLADQARAEAGIKTFTAVEVEAAVERGRRAAPPRRDADGHIEAYCAHPGCTHFEPDPATGLVAMVPVRKWWCPEHRVAREDDMQPWTPGYRVSEIGLVVDADDDADAERERQSVEAELARAKARRERSQAERRVALAERRQYERLRDQRQDREDLSLHGPLP
jgi:hypothetical protein